jgi:hypothetical protein
MTLRTPRRLASENYHAVLNLPGRDPQSGEATLGQHHLDITVARDSRGRACEIAFTGRGKIGHGLDQILIDLGIAVSRAIQGRDPQTGEEIPHA